MDNKYSKWIKTYIIDVLPAITIATYVLGIVYSTAFYYVFSIEITHFISLGEMFLDITNTLLLIIAAYLFIILYFYIYRRYLGKYYLITHFARFNRWVIGKVKGNPTGNVETSKMNAFFTMPIRYILYLFAALSLSLLITIAFYEVSNFPIEQGQGLMALPFLFSFVALMVPVPKIVQSIPTPKKSIYILVTVVMFYIFSVAVFAYCGNVNGRYVRDHDKATFEIKLKDGSILNNQSYRYINQVNNRVFLLDKKTNDNMILANDGIMYMKIYMTEYNSN